MMHFICILLNAAVLIYGGVVDFRHREIPDAVPITLLVTGCLFDFSMFWSIMGLIVPAVFMFMAAKMTKSEVPGGDFKLLCSLGFNFGLSQLALTIFLAGIGALVIGFLTHLPVKRHIPLCSYIAPAYLVIQAIALVAG